MAVLKLSTPGVYVQEISTLPPSVAEVETAIPAFIGYTEKADRFAAGDLKKVANKVNNLSEFVQFYGGPAMETNASISVSVTDNGSSNFNVSIVPVSPSQRSKYNLYYSVKHFYDNGGGTCYIVSMETYQTPSGVSDTLLLEGLDIVNEVTASFLPFQSVCMVRSEDFLLALETKAMMRVNGSPFMRAKYTVPSLSDLTRDME